MCEKIEMRRLDWGVWPLYIPSRAWLGQGFGDTDHGEDCSKTMGVLQCLQERHKPMLGMEETRFWTLRSEFVVAMT